MKGRGRFALWLRWVCANALSTYLPLLLDRRHDRGGSDGGLVSRLPAEHAYGRQRARRRHGSRAPNRRCPFACSRDGLGSGCGFELSSMAHATQSCRRGLDLDTCPLRGLGTGHARDLCGEGPRLWSPDLVREGGDHCWRASFGGSTCRGCAWLGTGTVDAEGCLAYAVSILDDRFVGRLS